MEMVDESLVDSKLDDVGDLSTCLLEDTTFDVQPARLNEKVASELLVFDNLCFNMLL
jgi:hypothetical protein